MAKLTKFKEDVYMDLDAIVSVHINKRIGALIIKFGDSFMIFDEEEIPEMLDLLRAKGVIE